MVGITVVIDTMFYGPQRMWNAEAGEIDSEMDMIEV